MLSEAAKNIAEREEEGTRRVFYFAFLLFFLYPFFRDVLPLGDVFWALSMLAGLFICAYRFNLAIVIVPTSYLWLILAAMALSSFLILGPESTVLPKRMGLFLLSIIMMIALGKNRIWMQPALAACLALLSIHAVATMLLNMAPGLYERYIAPVVHGSSVTVVGPKAGLTSHYSYNGQMMAIGLLISYALFKMSPLRGRKQLDRIKFGILALVFATSLLLTTKRAPLLICIVAIVVTECLLASRGRASTVYKVLAATFILGIVVVAFGDQIPMLSNVIERLSTFFTTNSLEESTTGRTLLWDRAIQLWRENPVFGSGWGTYRYQWMNGYQGVSIAAHNVFLQLLSEVGVVGMMVFLIPSLFIFVGLANQARLLSRGAKGQYAYTDAAVLFAFLFQLYFFAYCFVGAPLYDFESFPVYFILSCGVWYAVNASQVKERKTMHAAAATDMSRPR